MNVRNFGGTLLSEFYGKVATGYIGHAAIYFSLKRFSLKIFTRYSMYAGAFIAKALGTRLAVA